MDGRRVVVVGAGITGLSAAHRLAVDHPHLAVTVFEAGDLAGGNLRTSNVAFGGAGMDQLFITGALKSGPPGALFRIDLGVPGLVILPSKQ